MNMLKSYRAALISLSVLLVFVLSGCSNAGTIDAHSTGIWNHYFVYKLNDETEQMTVRELAESYFFEG
ncbi:hypothetical protein R0K05_20425, partial [Planococcus sp. SIMBA_160]